MNQDRIGTALMLSAAVWVAVLVFTLPPLDVSVPWRSDLIVVTIALLVVAFFPRRLALTGTVLAFSVLGVCINLAIFQFHAIGWQGVVPAVLLAVALWLRRERLDLKDVVGVAALVAFGIAIVQPAIVAFAWIVIAAVNLMLWLMNAMRSSRTSR